MDIISEVVRNSISVFFGLLQTAIVASFAVIIKLYIDVRSLKKAMNAAFDKIREIQEKLATGRGER